MKTKQTPKITVAIRKRPLNKKELQRAETDIIKIENAESVVVSQYKQKVDLTKYIQQTTFNFDYAFDQNSSNQQIYDSAIRPLIQSAFAGAKVSCFAYGQTGSGKTFTMKGDIKQGVPGLYYLGAKQIFSFLQHPDFSHLQVNVSFYQIYCGKLFDLLNNRTQLKIRQDKKANINVIGLQEKPIYSAQQFLDTIQYGSNFRVTSQNATNADSSRSHAIMQICLKDGKKVFTKISFIDLAGNQRGADHMDQNKQTKIDGAQINKSLLSLKQCIRALDQGKGHTPFRGSKLTMVLKDSFVGFCKTVMIGNVSPNVSSSQNTMNTLRYADRVKQLKKPSQNLTKEEMQAKQLMLPRAANKNVIKVNVSNDDDQEDIKAKLDNAKRRGMYQQKKPRGEHLFEPQKMEIQEPANMQKKGSLNEVFAGKKTDNTSNCTNKDKRNIKLENPKVVNSHNINNQNMNSQGYKKPVTSMPPALNNKNNNINTANQSQDHFKPKINVPAKNYQVPEVVKKTNYWNMSTDELNKKHFNELNGLHNQFQSLKGDHSRLIKEQTVIIKDQMIKLNAVNNSLEFDQEAEEYIDMIESCIQQKMDILKDLQIRLEKVRAKKDTCDELQKQLQNRKCTIQIEKVPIQQNNPTFNGNPHQLIGKNISSASSANLNMNINMNMMNMNNQHNKNIQPIGQNITMPKQQPYQYTYHSFTQAQNSTQSNMPNGNSVFNQQTGQLSQNKFYMNPTNTNYNGNSQVSGNWYQYHYSYANQGKNPNNNVGSLNNGTNLNNGNNMNGGNSNHQGYSYLGNNYQNSHSQMSSQSYSNHHDEQLLQGLPGDDNIQRLF